MEAISDIRIDVPEEPRKAFYFQRLDGIGRYDVSEVIGPIRTEDDVRDILHTVLDSRFEGSETVGLVSDLDECEDRELTYLISKVKTPPHMNLYKKMYASCNGGISDFCFVLLFTTVLDKTEVEWLDPVTYGKMQLTLEELQRMDLPTLRSTWKDLCAERRIRFQPRKHFFRTTEAAIKTIWTEYIDP